MAEIEILRFSDHRRFGALFKQPVWAEGSYGWFQSLTETTLAPGEEAIAAVAFEDDAAKAALPLARNGAAMRALTAPYTTHYAPALPAARWARFLGMGARNYVDGSLHLDALDPSDPGVAAFLDGMRSSGLIAAQYHHFVNRYEPVTNFEDYWNARPTRLKTTVRRKLALARAQQAEFHCYRDEFGKAVAIYEDIYRASWKPAEPHPEFITNMVEKLARDGFVRVGIMTMAGQPVAAQIWLVSDRKATIFKLAHRQDAAHYSPGTLLTHWLISKLISEEDLNEIDFGRGGDTYKSDWLARQRFRSGVIAGNWRSVSGLRAIVREVVPTLLSHALPRPSRSGDAVPTSMAADGRGLTKD
jgi:hypothetical protein